MNLEAEINDARAEMVFREEQLHGSPPDTLLELTWREYDKARDRYLALLAEDRIRKLREVTA